MVTGPDNAPVKPQEVSLPMGRFLTVAEVAGYLRVSNMTVYRLINAGQLAAVRVGRGYRIREEDVTRYLQQRYMDAG
ncbi:MAG: helix-turn-helix domain-containing protein [Actinomycetota bacterium]|jgi:excisionase family DNA binding protein